MSLKKELASLQEQKRCEMERLHRTFVLTRRDVKRNLSPGRFIRKHLGASLGVAAVVGLFVAPRPGPSKPPKSERKGGGASRFVTGLIKRLWAEVEKSLPHKKGHAATTPTGKSGMPGTLLETLLSLILTKFDFAQLIAQIMQKIPGMRSRRHEGNGHAPEMSVADAGTVHDDLEHFQ